MDILEYKGHLIINHIYSINSNLEKNKYTHKIIQDYKNVSVQSEVNTLVAYSHENTIAWKTFSFCKHNNTFML